MGSVPRFGYLSSCLPSLPSCSHIRCLAETFKYLLGTWATKPNKAKSLQSLAVPSARTSLVVHQLRIPRWILKLCPRLAWYWNLFHAQQCQTGHCNKKVMAAWAFTFSSTWSHAHQRYTIAATMCQLKGCDNPGKLTSHETFPPNRSATLHVQYPSLRIHSIVLACSWTTTVACGTSNVTLSWNLVTMLEKNLCWSNHYRSGMSSLVSFAARTFLWRCKHHLLLKLASRSCTKFTQHWEPAPCNIKSVRGQMMYSCEDRRY